MCLNKFERAMTMLEIKGLFALQYSLVEKDWRIEDLEVVLERNTGWFAKDEAGSDYKILAISGSRDQLRAYRKSLAKHKGEK